MAGISRFVLRNREHLALLMADDKVMYLAQMRYDDELRKPDDLKIPKTEPTKAELKMAEQLIKEMTKPFDPKRYKDTYEQNLKKIIEAKAKNQEIEVPEEVEKPADIDDLMAQLKKSLEAVSN
jgi:DNA end-binding protein Ku